MGEKPYFGVISVGDLSTLKKHLTPHIPLKTDGLSNSLFESIKKEDSSLHVLIGSNIEGWDTWRVSCMSLINIGKEQGTQIIQLFGRGIR
ncbi:MAG: hypothetical protein ACUVRD_08975 [Bacteroidia bacterium]